MKLLDEIANTIKHVETEFDVKLDDDNFANGREEILHIFLHETCHAALANRAPWIHDLDEEQHTAIDEIVARLLEDHTASSLGLPAHTPEDHVFELGMYPVQVTAEQYKHLRTEWQRRYQPDKDLEGMASYTRNYLFPAG